MKAGSKGCKPLFQNQGRRPRKLDWSRPFLSPSLNSHNFQYFFIVYMDSITNQFLLQIDVKGKCNESNQPHSSQKFYNELETLVTAAALKIGIKPSINSLFIGRQNFFQVQRIRKMSSTWGFLFRFVPLQSNQELHRSLWATWWWCTVSVAEKQNTSCGYRFFVLLFRNPIQMLPTRWTRDDYTSMGRCVHPYYQNLKIYIY